MMFFLRPCRRYVYHIRLFTAECSSQLLHLPLGAFRTLFFSLAIQLASFSEWFICRIAFWRRRCDRVEDEERAFGVWGDGVIFDSIRVHFSLFNSRAQFRAAVEHMDAVGIPKTNATRSKHEAAKIGYARLAAECSRRCVYRTYFHFQPKWMCAYDWRCIQDSKHILEV